MHKQIKDFSKTIPGSVTYHVPLEKIVKPPEVLAKMF